MINSIQSHPQYEANSISAQQMSFRLSFFNNKTDVKPKEVQWTWGQICERFKHPAVREAKDGMLFSPATFQPAYRLKNNVTELSLLVLDLDHDASFEADLAVWRKLKYCFAAYTTHSHLRATKSNPEAEERFRVVIPLAVPMPSEKFPLLWQWASRISSGKVDLQAQDSSRMYYAPAVASSEAVYQYYIEDGVFLDWRMLDLGTNTNTKHSDPANEETFSFQFHEDRHAELCKRIMARGQLNSRGNYDAQCLAHKGKGKTALVYFPDSGAIKCNAGCSYDNLLEAEGLTTLHLPSKVNIFVKPAHSEIEEETAAEWPYLQPKALYGLAGDFVRLVSPHSEADPMALLSQFLVAFGSIIGRNAHFTAEADKHFTNIFLVLVGATGAGRKGTSWGQIKLAFESLDDDWQKNCITTGMSSGEGLIYHVRDSITKQKSIKANDGQSEVNEAEIIDHGVLDKRLLAFEGEFASVLRAQGREGNTLSMVIRNLWDTGEARTLVKNSPTRTTGAHVSIVGHITKDELRSCLDDVESVNGYVNRFLWLCVKRDKFLPRGGRLNEVDFAPLKRRLRKAFDFAHRTGEMTLDDKAWELWDKAYIRLETGRTGLLGKVTQRASPYVRRLACIYALLDCSPIVRLDHLQAALVFWQYAEDSARFIFGARTGDRIADDILRALREASTDGLTLTAICELFSRNRSKAAVNRALQLLLECGLAYRSKDQTDGRGRPAVRWFVVSQSYERNERNIHEWNSFVSFVPPENIMQKTDEGLDFGFPEEREMFEL